MANSLEVLLADGQISLRATSTDGKVGQWEHYPLINMTSVTGVDEIGIGALDASNRRLNKYKYEDMLIVSLEFVRSYHTDIRFDIQTVSNQPTWTPDLAGLAQAITDINLAFTAATGGGGAAQPEGSPVEFLTNSIYTIPAGAFNIGIQNQGSGTADIDGEPFPSGTIINFEDKIDTAIELDGGGIETLYITYLI